MSTKTEATPGPLDTVKLVLAAAVLIGGIVGYYWFEEESLLLRVIGVLVGLGLGMLIAFQSTQGKELWRFIQGSRVELRKVIWPTPQETMQTTLTVFVFVLIMGIFFWLLDMGLGAIARQVTGGGG
ncbi:MAG: preprotein translocase subunit SecE [Gammaproteobacteria bacterium]|nr:preprotein translocase subunit SecE [Gammaproteobacteria bacterium]MBT8443351.1 preprotein translocase subunit SecE [Gammaproteobacteria bacterium]